MSLLRSILMLAALVLPGSSSLAASEQISAGVESHLVLERGWRFMPGDNLGYAARAFDDQAWKPIQVGLAWQKQGWEQVQGYAWYRLRFTLPERLRAADTLKEGLRLSLGAVADYDQCFLNGQMVGANGTVVPVGSQPDEGFWKADENLPGQARTYLLRTDDPRLKWGQENVLAVRVYMVSGWGGLMGHPLVRMMEPSDFLGLNPGLEPFEFKGGKLRKAFTVANTSDARRLKGRITLTGTGLLSGASVVKRSFDLDLAPRAHQVLRYAFDQRPEACRIRYILDFDGGGAPVECREESPYLLTPRVPAAPRINGPEVVGGRPGHAFLFTVPVSGQKPIRFAAEGLPRELSLDPATGILQGTLPAAGRYTVTLTATNAKGSTQRKLDIVSGSGLALTPPMGWNSWNAWGLAVDEEKVVASARTIVDKGLRDHGWASVNIDDGWEISTRDGVPVREADGSIKVNGKFPDMARLGRRLHGLGLKFGIYSSPGPATCGGYAGSYQHEEADARAYAAWGVDYLKYDWCSYSTIAQNLDSIEELKQPYARMNEALRKVDRDIVYSLCQYGMGKVWEWGDQVGGQLWRTTGDISDSWDSMSKVGFSQVEDAPFAGPGHWNDPDMLVVGWVG
ncbi:MAG TPA: putative Ig domain-containing protein, partial [Geothrix sp.]|nr:putative Ig domain-containing protein [Geothrix sp.]